MIVFRIKNLMPFFCAGIMTLGTAAPALAQSKDQTQQYFEISKNLEIMTNVFRELNESYVNPIQPGKMTKTGINAMLEGLDPYTNFFTEADAENYKIAVQGEYGGIGILTKKKDSLLVVATVFENSPADQSGIHVGDILLSVNGQNLINRNEDELAILMRGDKGASLSLEIQNPVSNDKRKVKVTRSQISISDVPYAGLMGDKGNIAYVRLSQFMGPASFQIKRALDSLKNIKSELSGVVLDLRGNPGGLLKEAVRTCNLFIQKGQTVVTTKGKGSEWSKTFQTTGEVWDAEIPLVVLINNMSASASEIVAGTMQDLDRGVVIGARSYGKGLVQEVKDLGFNTGLKLTVAYYYTPANRCIQVLDYAHRREDGSVSEIPESMRHLFKTRNGRPVKDGGGIEPDIYINAEDPSSLMRSLSGSGYVFDYATRYFHSHKSIAAAEKFRLSDKDFADFRQWLLGQDFMLGTKEGKLLADFKKEAQKNKQFADYQSQYDALLQQLKTSGEKQINQNSSDIINLLGNEIVERYYYQKGKALNKLTQDDPSLKKAIEVIQNPKEYKKILKG